VPRNYGDAGNIRELGKLIERRYGFTEHEVTAKDIPRFVKQDDSEKSLLLDDIEKQHIEYVMDLYNVNQSRSAEALGIVVNTLKSKLDKYGMKREEFL